MKKNNEGMALLGLVLVLALILLAVGGASYYVLRARGVDIQSLLPVATVPVVKPTVAPLESVADLKKELDTLEMGSIDADIKDLNSQALPL